MRVFYSLVLMHVNMQRHVTKKVVTTHIRTYIRRASTHAHAPYRMRMSINLIASIEPLHLVTFYKGMRAMEGMHMHVVFWIARGHVEVI